MSRSNGVCFIQYKINISMKSFYVFTSCVLCVLACCSCTLDSVVDEVDFHNLPTTVEESGILNQTDDSYTVFVRLQSHGYGSRTYEASLQNVSGMEQNLEAKPIVSGDITASAVLSPLPDGDAVLEERTEEDLIIRKIRMDYVLVFADTELPVSFVTERAFFRDGYGEHVLPMPKVEFSLEEPEIEKADTLLVDDVWYGRYFVKYRANASTASSGRTVSSETSAVVMKKLPVITFDVTVDDWCDAGNEQLDF